MSLQSSLKSSIVALPQYSIPNSRSLPTITTTTTTITTSTRLSPSIHFQSILEHFRSLQIDYCSSIASWLRKYYIFFHFLINLYSVIFLIHSFFIHFPFFIRRSLKCSVRNTDKERRLNANMIERRRMQNINLGFTSLKRLLPPTEKKQTKAAILQQAVQHILRLQRTVVQVRENNNMLRENLADERKQSLCCRSQLGILLSEKYTRETDQVFSHMAQTKGQVRTPPHEEPSDSSLNRWLCLPYGNSEANYKGHSAVDLPSSHDPKRRELNSVMEKKCVNSDGKRDHGRRLNHFVRMSRHSARGDESAPSNTEVRVGYFPSTRDTSDAGTSGHGPRGNNLHCILDAINFIEKK